MMAFRDERFPQMSVLLVLTVEIGLETVSSAQMKIVECGLMQNA